MNLIEVFDAVVVSAIVTSFRKTLAIRTRSDGGRPFGSFAALSTSTMFKKLFKTREFERAEIAD